MRAFLGQVGGRQVDRDPLGRQRQADRGQRGADPLAAFGHRLVGQADDDEARAARRTAGPAPRRRAPRARDRRPWRRSRPSAAAPRTTDNCTANIPLARRSDASAQPAAHASACATRPRRPHRPRMITREQWRGFIDHPVVEWTIFVARRAADRRCRPWSARFPARAGSSSSPSAWRMVLKTSMWAKRRYVRFKRWQPKVGRWTDWGLRRKSARRRASASSSASDRADDQEADAATVPPTIRPESDAD